MKQLIIIPGLGDRGWLYRFAVPLWAVLGFRAHIFTFGWNSRGSYAGKMRRLYTYVEKADSPVYIIGASAGGTAAVNALAAWPEKVARVVTIATPYDDMPALHNNILRESITQLKANLRRMDSRTRGQIVSMHGKKDTTVPIHKSQTPGVATVWLSTTGHARTISLALTLYCDAVYDAFRLTEKRE